MSIQDLNIAFYQANKSNYSRGRGKVISKITVHHMAGQPNTLRWMYENPNTNSSANFGVFPDKIEQYVRLNDTPWTNSNWDSNQESITIETWGDWRNGFVNITVLAHLKALIKELRKIYPAAQLNFHHDVALEAGNYTDCPCELRSYAKKIWNEITKELAAPAPSKPKIVYSPITPQKVKLIRNANLWNFNFTDWSQAQAVKSFAAGQVIDVVAIATNSLGGRYYMTPYSYNDGKIRATNGFNIVDCEDYVEPILQPEAPKPETPAEQTPEPAHDVEPDTVNTDTATPTEHDAVKRINFVLQILNKLFEALKKIFNFK